MKRSPLLHQLASPVKRAATESYRYFNIVIRRSCRLPDFIIIGAQKAATTSLYEYLVQHPDVDSAIIKEVHFFDNRFYEGEKWYRSNFPDKGVRGHEKTGTRLVGEASPYYFVHPHVPARVRSVCPQVRLIVLLRDPVARAVSQYFHEKRRGFERLPLIEALSNESARIAGEATKLEDPRYQSHAFGHFTYVTRGLYAEQLRNWYRYFDRAQLLVLESEMLRTSPRAVLSDVAQFLGLSRWQPNVSKMHNPGGTYSAPDEVVDWLKTRFAGPNRELCELLGREFSWAAEG